MAPDKDEELQRLRDWINNLPQGITDEEDANKKIAQMRSLVVDVDRTIARLVRQTGKKDK